MQPGEDNDESHVNVIRNVSARKLKNEPVQRLLNYLVIHLVRWSTGAVSAAIVACLERKQTAGEAESVDLACYS